VSRPADELAAAPAGALARRGAVAALAVGLPVSAIFALLAVRGLDTARLERALASAEPGHLLLAVAAIAGVVGLQALRWQRLVRPAGRLPWRASARMLLCAVAVNNVVPGRPGELLRSVWLARRLRLSQGLALATVIVDRSADVAVLAVALAAAYPFLPHPAWLRDVVEAAAALTALLLLALALARRLGRRGAGREGLVRRQLAALGRGTAMLGAADALVVALLSAAAWALWALAAWLVAAGMGLRLTPLEALFVTAVVNLGAAIPSSPGFVGTFQWLCVTGLALFGIGRTDAFAFSLLLHASWYVPTTLAGALAGGWRRPAWRPHRRPAGAGGP
jgi:glycosyltransferase 2 family protein